MTKGGGKEGGNNRFAFEMHGWKNPREQWKVTLGGQWHRWAGVMHDVVWHGSHVGAERHFPYPFHHLHRTAKALPSLIGVLQYRIVVFGTRPLIRCLLHKQQQSRSAPRSTHLLHTQPSATCPLRPSFSACIVQPLALSQGRRSVAPYPR